MHNPKGNSLRRSIHGTNVFCCKSIVGKLPFALSSCSVSVENWSLPRHGHLELTDGCCVWLWYK
jgi:hypothetical protein